MTTASDLGAADRDEGGAATPGEPAGGSRPFATGARTVVLAYHRVADPTGDVFHLRVSPERFADQLRILLRRAEPATLDDVLAPSRKRRFVVTFDDGYADNATTAAPIAGELGVPITVFVTSGMVGTTEGFWWDRLARLVLDPTASARPGATSPDGVAIDLSSPRARMNTLFALHATLRELPVGDIALRLAVLSSELGVDSVVASGHRPMSEPELRCLDAARLATIGAHTTDHSLLSGRDLASQLSSVLSSKRDLERLLGHRVDHLAYPYGGADSLDAASLEAAAAAHFVTASTTFPGSLKRSTSRFALRRRLVMNWAPRRFELQALRWGL